MASPFGFMPPTLTGQENDPNQQLMAAILAAGRGMDYSGPAPSGGPPPSPYAWAPQSVLQNDFAPMAQGTAMPQLPAEQEDLRQQMTGSGNFAMAAAPFALGPVLGPAMRTAGAFVRSNPIPAIAGALGFGAVPAATQSEPQQPSQLRIDPKDIEISGARAEVERITGRQGELRQTLKGLQEQLTRFDPERLNALSVQDRTKEVKKLQEELKKLNLYRGNVDGSWGDITSAAVQARRAQIEKAQADANKELGDLTGQFTTENRRLTGLQRQQQRDRTERDMPWWDRALRDYGTPIGLMGGGPFGFAGRWGVTRSANRMRELHAERANELISRNYSNVSDRVGGVNRFYQEGGGNPPFRLSSGARGGFTETNRGRNAVPQTPATDLYPAGGRFSQYVNPASDVPAVGALGGFGIVGEVRLQQALSDLEAAKAAADANGSPENMDNLARAEARVNQVRLQARVLQGAPLGYISGGARLRYRDIRPDVDLAAGEVRRLSNWRRRQ